MNCTDNLPICKAACCKVLPFDIKCPIGHPMEDYYKKRGILLIRLSRDTIKVLVPHQCEQLTEDDHCKLHGTPDKPHVCRAFNEDNAKNANYFIPKNCIYEEKK